MANDQVWDFKAELHLLPTGEGGRKEPFEAGGGRYRPQFYLDDPEYSSSCFIDNILGKTHLAPGEVGHITARLLKPELFKGRLKPGMRFQIREIANPVAWGTIVQTNI